MPRIDTHHHLIPPEYRNALRRNGIDEAGGRALPDWSPEGSLKTMAELDVTTAIVSVSTPGTTFLPAAADASALANDLNDYSADLVASQPDRFGFFATIPMPHIDESVTEVVRSLDDLNADGVVVLANNAGTYLGEAGQDDLFAALDERAAVVFIHPAELPGPAVPGVAPFAADFLLDTSRTAYLLVRNGIRRRYPNIRFILGHAGGFVPYAAHRMAVAIMADTGTSPADSLDDFSSFYFDTACHRVPRRCRPCSRSQNRDTSRSALTGRSRPSRPASSSPPDWKPIRAWTPTPETPSTGRMRCRCSPASVGPRPFGGRALKP